MATICKTVLSIPFFFSLLILPSTIFAQPYDYPTATLSTKWPNTASAKHSIPYSDGSTIRAILLRGTYGPKYACGFFCNGTNCDQNYMFAIFIVQTNSASYITTIGYPQVVWSANRNNPVRINSSLELSSTGDLILKNDDGRVAWSSNTSGKGVVGLNLTETGNLILFDSENRSIWNSFDYPTDTMVPGQKLVSGQKLTASVSKMNFTDGGVLSLTVSSEGLFVYANSDPPQIYYDQRISGPKNNTSPSYVKYVNGSLSMYILSSEPKDPDGVISIPLASSAQYMKLESDGHLRVYEWGVGWGEVADVITEYLGECAYPMACGKNGLCSSGQCSCPKSKFDDSSYFKPVNGIQPDLGCEAISALDCRASENHKFIELDNTTYFTFNSDITGTDVETCKSACLRNCSCKAVLFHYWTNSSDGDCYFPSQIYSMMVNDKERTHYNASAYVKVQIVPKALSPSVETPQIKEKKSNLPIILGSIGGGLLLFLMVFFLFFFLLRKKYDNNEDDYLDLVPGMPTRFSYEELKITTENFTKKLGEGGFGSVFEGALNDGSKIAVKCLDGVGQVKRSFLAEVESIGSIHHVNLVRLIGFCSEKSHRLLVYEYMSNGSLERWIYEKNQELPLGWQFRKKIVHDIAKGLAYLHEDCRQKIIHLDIKPQNILLDENFNAKVGDFGLSKLIDRDQSQVMTTMRGTPGYLAPEWLSSVITEKVDVYAFGIVVLEMMCGRKNFDRSEADEDMHLLKVFKRRAEEERLIELVDNSSEDMQAHKGEVCDMIKLAGWCLQSDYTKRPSMSTVIKVLEGVLDVKKDLDYSLSYAPFPNIDVKLNMINSNTSPLLPSVLSGPR